MAPIRVLLDEGFPEPPSVLPIALLDRHVDYVHLSAHEPELVNASTPDWMLYIVAWRDGFDAIVSRDLKQLQQDEELVALVATELTMVLTSHPLEDPIAEWGQLLAYGPQIVRKMRAPGYQPSVIRLPSPRLNQGNMTAPKSLVRELAARRAISFPELRSAATSAMRNQLANAAIPAHSRLSPAFEKCVAKPRSGFHEPPRR